MKADRIVGPFVLAINYPRGALLLLVLVGALLDGYRWLGMGHIWPLATPAAVAGFLLALHFGKSAQNT